MAISSEQEVTTHNQIAQWFSTWGGYVATCNFDDARALFDPGVTGFGTYMDSVVGLDALEQRQWRSIWPTISGFKFLTETLTTFVSDECSQVSAMIVWDSEGYDREGTAYPRPGRTTAVFRRAGDDWKCIHTHFSEFPREAQRSFGKPK